MEAQEAMGHADIHTTLNIYAKAVPGWQEQAAAKLDAHLDSATGSLPRTGFARQSRFRNRAVDSGSPAVENRPLEPKWALRRGVERISNPCSGTTKAPQIAGVFTAVHPSLR
jgi:hypothetical protein